VRYTVRGFKYEADTPMARLQELENKVEDESLIDISIAKPKTKGEQVQSDLQNWINSFDGGIKEFSVLCSALILIQKQDKEIFKLENRLKECENGYEGTRHLERCKLHDAEEKVRELKQANEMLSESYEHLEKAKDELLKERARLVDENEKLKKAKYIYSTVDYCADDLSKAIEENKRIKVDTVKKMQSKLRGKFYSDCDYPGYSVKDCIDKTAKELLEGEGC